MLLQSLKYINSRFSVQKDINDSNLFQKMHHLVTTTLLLVCFTVLVFNQSTGSHIYCVVGRSSLQGIIDQYCYWLSTFILAGNGNEGIYHGLGPPKGEVKTVAYYQWVQLFFLFQCASFYTGRLYWKMSERKRLARTLNILTEEAALYKESEDKILNRYIEESTTLVQQEAVYRELKNLLSKTCSHVRPFRILAYNRDRGLQFVLVEVINLVALSCQLYITNIFLQGQFAHLGLKWVSENPRNLLDTIFPKMTKCTFENTGPSGSMERSDAMCFLPQNILHEKIFLFLWFWYLILLSLTLLGFCTHLVQYFFFKRITYHRLTRCIVNSGKAGQKVLNLLTYSDFIYLTHILDSSEFQKFNLFMKLLQIDADEDLAKNPIIKMAQTIKTPNDHLN